MRRWGWVVKFSFIGGAMVRCDTQVWLEMLTGKCRCDNVPKGQYSLVVKRA